MVEKQLREYSKTEGFLAQFESAMTGLRGALTELLASVAADPAAPRELSRRFRVNRNLAWKICRIVNAVDSCDAVQHLPGNSGIAILLTAMEREGAPAQRIEQVRSNLEAFDRMVKTHVGDRPNLELMLTSMLPGRMDPARLESSRRLTFLGNSATLGVQMKVRAGASIVAPNAGDSEFIDLGVISGLYGFKRLRPVTRWPLTQSKMFNQEGDTTVPIDPDVRRGEVPYLKHFSSSNLPETNLRKTPNGFVCELEEGPVGTTGAFDSVFGWLQRPLARFRQERPGEVGEFTATCDAPAEYLQYDLLIHRDLPMSKPPSFHAISRMQGDPGPPYCLATAQHLPIPAEVRDLGAPAVLATPHVPRYPELIQFACERMGHDLADFRAYRVLLKYPAIPAIYVYTVELPE